MSTIYRVHQESVFIFMLKLSKAWWYALVVSLFLFLWFLCLFSWTTDEIMKRKKIGIFNEEFLPASR